MHNASGINITFLDEDHVLDLLRDLLLWGQAGSKERVREFFSPELVAEQKLVEIAENVRSLGRVNIQKGYETGPDTDVVLCRRGVVDGGRIAAAPRLRLVQRLGNSTKGIDLERLKAAGISVSLLPRRSLEHVADHAMLLALSLARRANVLAPAMRGYAGPEGIRGEVAYNWPAIEGLRALEGMILGIVGYGEIGGRLARRARAFGLNLVYTDKTRLPAAVEQQEGLTYMALDDLVAVADIVSVHVPPIGLTRPLIGAREIDLMKRDAVLINTSRGALIDQDALVLALRAGQLGGAGLDVFAAEPLAGNSPLFDIPNLVLTPHIAGGSRVDVLKELAAIWENIAAAFSGNPPPHARVLP